MKRLFLLFCLLCLSFSVFSMGNSDDVDYSTWPDKEITIICPWAVGGVADVVNRSLASIVSSSLGVSVLATNEVGAGGNVALSNYVQNSNSSYEFILGCEGPFAISPLLEGSDALLFSYSDYVPVINFYSSIMLLSASKNINVNDLDDLKEYGKNHRITVAVNGVTGAEAFLARALLESLNLEYVLINYNGANLALSAAARGETDLVVSHQSQALSQVESGSVVPIVVFDNKRTDNEPFEDVASVAEYGINAYYPNTCCLMAKKGTDERIIEKIKSEYIKAFEKKEMKELYDSLLIEMDPMLNGKYDEHIESVSNIVRSTLDG